MALLHVAAGEPPLPTRVFGDGTRSEEERLGALGDLQLAPSRLGAGGDVLVAATDKLLTLELAGPLRFARERAGHPVRAHARPAATATRPELAEPRHHRLRLPHRRRRASCARSSRSSCARAAVAGAHATDLAELFAGAVRGRLQGPHGPTHDDGPESA